MLASETKDGAPVMFFEGSLGYFGALGQLHHQLALDGDDVFRALQWQALHEGWIPGDVPFKDRQLQVVGRCDIRLHRLCNELLDPGEHLVFVGHLGAKGAAVGITSSAHIEHEFRATATALGE